MAGTETEGFPEGVHESSRSRPSTPAPIAFGVVLRDRDDALFPPIERMAAFVSARAGIPISTRAAGSYEELAQLMTEGLIHVAWLPPVPFLELEGAKVVLPLLTIVRAGQRDFASVLLVAAAGEIDSLEALAGKRAAWVDRWSSSGYVVPRINLAARGHDPTSLFASNEFFGSHEGAIRALLRGEADVVGTFGRSEADGVVRTGGWAQIEGGTEKLRILASFGRIPGDLFAVSTSIARPERDILAAAIKSAHSDPSVGADMKRVFNADELVLGDPASFDELRAALKKARDSGLL